MPLQEADQVQMTEAQLARDGWPNADEQAAGYTQPRFSCLIAEDERSKQPCGFALFFYNYSTWEGMGVYLEDLYVSPAARGAGVGTRLIKAVAQVAVEHNCARLQWQVIDFNKAGLDFYVNRVGARERVETGDAKWMNMIMDRAALAKFTSSL